MDPFTPGIGKFFRLCAGVWSINCKLIKIALKQADSLTFFQIDGWIKCDHKINMLSVKKTDVIASAKVY